MPVPVNIYLERAGWADVLLREGLQPSETDTIEATVPANSAFRLLAESPNKTAYWAESSLIFAISAFRFEWRILSPLYLREQRRSANQ